MMQNRSLKLVIAVLLCHCAGAAGPGKHGLKYSALARLIPPRRRHALTGSEFVKYVSKMDPQQREAAIREEILEGDVPGFLRRLVPVKLRYRSAGNRAVVATIFVMPDYLSIGSDDDYVRIPMNLYSALSVATHLGFVLPTTRMVDAIYAQSALHLAPQPLPAGPSMRSTEYYWLHNQMIERQLHRLGFQLGELISGDKKDVVMTNRLAQHPDRVAIYGWQRLNGVPIQPLSTVHGAGYADYSHGIRLVSDKAIVDGQIQSVDDVLRDPKEAKVLSSEGPINLWLWGHVLHAQALLPDARQ